MNVNKSPQVRLTIPPEPPPDSVVNNLSDRNKGRILILRADDLIINCIYKSVIGLAQVYDRYKNSSQEPAKGPSRSEQFFNSHKKEIGYAERFLAATLPENLRPFPTAAKNIANNYFSLKGFQRGGAVNTDLIKYNSLATSFASMLHAAMFFPGSKGQGILDSVQSVLNSAMRGSPRYAPPTPDFKSGTRLLMCLAGTMMAKEYTKNSSYSYDRTPIRQTESSEKLMRKKDQKNSREFLVDHCCVSIAAAMILTPIVKNKIGQELLRLMNNPTELCKSLTKASVPAVVGLGTSLWIANRMDQSAHRTIIDTVPMPPSNQQSN